MVYFYEKILKIMWSQCHCLLTTNMQIESSHPKKNKMQIESLMWTPFCSNLTAQVYHKRI